MAINLTKPPRDCRTDKSKSLDFIAEAKDDSYFSDPNEPKFYTVLDNSYQECINDGTNHYLAGTSYEHPKPFSDEVEIIVPRFMRKFIYEGAEKERPFIIGKCKKGLFHLILHYP